MNSSHPILAALVILGLGCGICRGQGRLAKVRNPVLWSGSVARSAGPVGEVPECSHGCQKFELTVDLPPDVWKNKPGGVQIAIRWPGLTSAMGPGASVARGAASGLLGDNLKLYIYRSASLIAASDGTSSLAQSVLILHPPNGSLRVYVAYDPASPAKEIAFEGLAEVEYSPAAKPTRPLLPDLEARPQRHVTFDPGPIFAKAVSEAHPSCYYTEVEEEGARTCLRFDQVFANVGEGPLEVRFSVPHGSTLDTHAAYQRIYWSDDPQHVEDRPTSRVELHREHAHYHLMTFAVSRLWSVADASDPKHPKGLKIERAGNKVSFCMVDTEIDAWAKKGDDPRKWKSPDCNYPVSKDAASDSYAQGITKGWKDVYEWYLPHQYIEVSGLTDGTYVLESKADPNERLLESSETNNCGSVYVRLSGMQTGSQSAEILGPGPACSALARTYGK